jgi:chorismate mutase/prephenate dehydratase
MTLMADDANALRNLRREIDNIDDSIHELLIRRTEVVGRIASVKKKNGGVATGMRPGREAEVVRRLLARHRGGLPPAVIVRLWRELIAAFTRLQGPLSVSVCAPEKSVGYWDLARFHFGSTTPMSLHRSANVVLRQVARGETTVGVLPLPDVDEEEPWWPLLASDTGAVPKVIARLPFVEDEAARFEDLGALVVAMMPQDDTSDDRSLIVVRGNARISRAGINQQLEAAGLDGQILAGMDREADRPDWLYLVEVAGFLAETDPRLAGFVESSRGRVTRVVPIGGYANPVEATGGRHAASAAE